MRIRPTIRATAELQLNPDRTNPVTSAADVTGTPQPRNAGRRLDQAALWRLVRRRAGGVEYWAALSPHSLGHRT